MQNLLVQDKDTLRNVCLQAKSQVDERQTIDYQGKCPRNPEIKARMQVAGYSYNS